MKELIPVRMETTKLMTKLVDDFYANVCRAPEEGILFCLVIGPFPFELLRAMDIRFAHLENWGARCAARKVGEKRVVDEFQRAAEARGYHMDTCSYLRNSVGAVYLSSEGALKSEFGPYLLPHPDLICCCNPCQIQASWFDVLRRMYPDVPWFFMDTPMGYRPDDYGRYLSYVKQQVEECIRFLEKVSGRQFDFDRLSEIMVLTKKGAEARRATLDMTKAKPSPISSFDLYISLAAMTILRGSTESVDYLDRLVAEAREKVARGISAVTEEKIRLYWDFVCIWFKLGHLAKLFAKYGACLVGDNYTRGTFYYEPEMVDPCKAVDSIAHEQLRNWVLRPLDSRISFTLEQCRELSCDGIVLHAARTCRPISIGQHQMKETVLRDLGIPGVIIEADHTDPKCYSVDQVDRVLEQFLEMLWRTRVPT